LGGGLPDRLKSGDQGIKVQASKGPKCRGKRGEAEGDHSLVEGGKIEGGGIQKMTG